MTRTLSALVLVGAVLLAGCGGDDGDDARGSATTSAASATSGAATASSMAASAGGDLELTDTALGRVLADDAGMVLYLFTPDAQGDSTCYGDCEEAWPVVSELSGVGDGLDDSLLGTTTRDDGSVQATYNDWPLYHFAADGAPGEVNGQGVRGVWYVLDADGAAVMAAAPGAIPAASGALPTTTTAAPGY